MNDDPDSSALIDPGNSFEWYTGGLPEGVYHVYAVIRDDWSSTQVYAPGPLIVDRTPPAVTVDPLSDPLRQSSVVLSGTMEEGATVTITADQPVQTSWVWHSGPTQWYCQVDGLAGGPATFTATAADTAGNSAVAQVTTTVNLNQAPLIYAGGDRSVGEGQLLLFWVYAYDPDGTTPVVGAAPLPPGATFEGITFSWQPGFIGPGSYPVSFTADDGDLSAAETITITVLYTNRAPTVPVLLAPISGSEVPTPQPVLEVENSADVEGDALFYEFEVYGDAGLSWPLLNSGPIPQAAPTTTWTASWELPDNTWVWWRARAGEGQNPSAWTEPAKFFVNFVNDPPGVCAVSEPQQNAAVATTAPTLGVGNSVDPDGDTVSYGFRVCTDEQMTQTVASIVGLPAGVAGITSWVVDPPLNDNTRYYWKATATDEHGAAAETAALAFFVNLANEAPSAPVVAAPVVGEELPALETSLTVVNAVDPDYDSLWYYFELDSVSTFDGPGKVYLGAIPEGSGSTSWPLAGLGDNTLYYWRVRANDGQADSPWATGSFFINTANDPPEAVLAQNPVAGASVDSVTPRLEISTPADPDGDRLTYAYQIYAEPPGAPVAEGQSPETAWISNQTLQDHTRYSWRARAVDEHELEGPWSELAPFFVNNNGIDDPPSLTLSEPRAPISTGGAPVAIAWEDGDPDSDADIALYRDSDGAGADRVLIADGIKEDPDGDGDQYQWDISGVPEGAWRIYGEIRDATGVRASYAPGAITIDRTAPEVVVEPAGGFYGAPQTVLLSVSEPATIHITTDGTAPDVMSPVYEGPILVNDALTLRWIAVDAAGNPSVEGGADYVIDTLPPTVSIDPLPDPLRQNYATLTGTMEAGVSVSIAVDQPVGNVWVWYPDATQWSCDVYGLAGGPATFTATAVDAAGNSAVAQVTTTVNLNQAPVIYAGGDRTVGEGKLLLFDVIAYDPDGTTPVVGATPLPPGASFDGTTFSWQPGFSDAGSYTMTFTADDGDLSAAETITIMVQHTNRAPTVPVLLAPVTLSEVPALQPVLEVENSADADGDALSYEFELYGDAGLSWPLLYSGPIPQATPTTTLTALSELPDNTWIWWRARAVDGLGASDWTEAASFFVNLANDPPGVFLPSEPQENAEVDTTTPTLGVSNSVDPDGDTVSYAFLVYDNAATPRLVSTIAGLPAGEGGVTSWVVDPPLGDNTRYSWKATATDEHGAAIETAALAFFVNLANEAPSAPVVAVPAVGEELPALETGLTVVNAVDPDFDSLWYYFELDSVETFDGPGKVYSWPIPEGEGSTVWPLAGLSDNTWYYWRVRANDGLADSPWATSSLFTNTANDPPAAVVAHSPGAGAWVDSVTPRLAISAAADPDGDQVMYHYLIYAEPPGAPVVEGESPETSWVPNTALADNTWYSWRARAVDEHELEGPWSELVAFFVNNNGIDDPPSLTLIEPATAIVTSGAPVTIRWADGDPDSDADIALYRDSDGAGADGVLIADGLKEDPDGAGDQFTWDSAGVPSGTWHIYGVISDATSARVGYAPGTVTIDRQAPATSITPPPGTYAGAVTVTMTAVDDLDPSPSIYYTTDGSAPTVQSARYTGPITLTQTATLRYFAVDNAGLQEAPKGPAVYTIQIQVAVVAPNGGEVIASGSTYTVRWGAPSNATKFDLAYSTNNGSSYTSIATGRTGYSYVWTVPKPTANSTQCRIRVIGKSASGSTVGTDASDQVFTIEVVRVTSPNGGEVYSRAATRTRPITWVTNGTSQTVNKVTLSYSTNGGGAWTKITDLTTNPGTYTWTLPATNGSQYRVKVDLYRSSTLLGSDTSNANFTIGP